MSEPGHEAPGADVTGGSTASDPTRDPWSRPAEPPSDPRVTGAGAEPAAPSTGYVPPASQAYAGPQPGQVPFGQEPQFHPPVYGQPAAGPTPYGQPPYGQSPYGNPYPSPHFPGGYAAVTQNSSRATTVLVLGIISIVLVLSCGIGIVPAVIALAMSGGAKREIEQSGGRLGGSGMVTAGRVTSWVTVGLFTVGVVVLALIVGSGGNSSRYGGF